MKQVSNYRFKSILSSSQNQNLSKLNISCPKTFESEVEVLQRLKFKVEKLQCNYLDKFPKIQIFQTM